MNYGKALFTCLIPLAVTACATTPARQPALAEYPFHHDAFDLKVAWKTAPAPQGATIVGAIKNVRYLQIRDAEVTVLLLNREKKELAKGRSFTAPNYIDEDNLASFDINLASTSINKGDQLQFIINYYVTEDDTDSFVWVTSFTVDALTGVQVGSY